VEESLRVSSKAFLFRSIFMMKQRILPIKMKTIRTMIKIIDCYFEPKPIITVKRASEMNAQIKELPFNRPVI